jgi:hypothetical protein
MNDIGKVVNVIESQQKISKIPSCLFRIQFLIFIRYQMLRFLEMFPSLGVKGSLVAVFHY